MKPACVYCGREKESMDHVPPKLLLESSFPSVPPNRPTVPACRDCNNEYSDDEEYFRTILAHVAVKPYMSSKVGPDGVVDRALRKHSPGQAQELLNSIVVSEEGLPMLEPDRDRLRRVVRKIAAGLTFLEYSTRIHPGRLSAAGLVHLPSRDPRAVGLRGRSHTEAFEPMQWTDVQPNVFSYVFVRNAGTSHDLTCIMEFHREFWGYARAPAAVRRAGPPPKGNQLKLFGGHESRAGTSSRKRSGR